MNDDLSPELKANSVVQHQELLERLHAKDDPHIVNSPQGPPENSFEHQDSRPRFTYKGSFRAQVRAIFLKNFALQSKQKGTNFCQVFTPIICLLFTLLVKYLASKNLSQYFSFVLPVPYLHNVPYQMIYGESNPLLNKSTALNITSCEQWYYYDFSNASPDTMDFIGDNENGMLSNIFPPSEDLQSFYECNGTMMPYFKKPVNGSINNEIYHNMKYLNTLNFTPPEDVPDLTILPDGAVTFHEANKDSLDFVLQINDLRVHEYHRANGVTRYLLPRNESQLFVTQVMNVYEGHLILLDLVHKAYLRTLHDDKFILSGTQVMPQTVSGQAIFQAIMNTVAAGLYPIALSLLMPVFMHMIVLEKEERLREIMKMNGLKMRNYWFVNYIWSFLLYIATMAIFIIFGYFVLKTDFFLNTDMTVLVVCLIGWGLSQISISFCYQNFLAKAKTAMIVGYILALWTALAAATFSSGVYQAPQEFPLVMRLYPPFAFGRLVYYLTLRCNDFTCIQSFSQFNYEMWFCFKVLYIGAIVFLVLGLYLDAVLPQEYGVRKHPLFFLKWLLGRNAELQAKKRLLQNSSAHRSIDTEGPSGDVAILAEGEDDEVRKERAYIEKIEAPYNKHPLIIRNLRKVYKAVGGKPPKVAVKDFSLHIPRGEMFGLLGPNGAGKTSLISMLTGLYPPEGGNAWVGGYSIINEIDSVHTQMGVCPQFDLLWPDLTVEEHLLFYARIRGVPDRLEKALVEKAIKEVYLTRFASFKTKQLSGGMKRRLSVAISLVGEPQIIFLDEPTTGLDPENRRQLWDILVEAKGSRAIVLTTHSMEEADVLCNRIGIITDGALRCLGNQTKLKSKYGGGYHLFINCHKDSHFNNEKTFTERQNVAERNWDRLQEYIRKLLPNADLKSAFNGSFIYLVPLEGLEVSKLFEELESRRQELAISDWGISQSTLEDVFMQIVETSDAFEEEHN